MKNITQEVVRYQQLVKRLSLIIDISTVWSQNSTRRASEHEKAVTRGTHDELVYKSQHSTGTNIVERGSFHP